MADHPLFSISVVTPEGPAFEGDAEMLIVPGDAGGHVHFLSLEEPKPKF